MNQIKNQKSQSSLVKTKMKDYPNSVANTRCLMKACDNLSIPFDVLDQYGNFVKVKIGENPMYFINAKTPFNSDSFAFICRDKDFSYKFLNNQIRMPKTISYFDPNISKAEFTQFSSVDEIVEDVQNNFQFPIIVKMNSGSATRNVFICRSKESTKKSFEKIFNKELKDYDFIALAQELLEKESEYRVVMFRGEVLLVYKKSGEGLNINEGIGLEIKEFVSKSENLKEIEYTGLDILRDKKGDLYLIEANTFPSIESFVENNGEEQAIEMYEKILKSII